MVLFLLWRNFPHLQIRTFFKFILLHRCNSTFDNCVKSDLMLMHFIMVKRHYSHTDYRVEWCIFLFGHLSACFPYSCSKGVCVSLFSFEMSYMFCDLFGSVAVEVA